MSDTTKFCVDREVKRIQSEVASRSRAVEPGCVIRIPFSCFSDELRGENSLNHIYGVVGREIDYYVLTTSRAYNVSFNMKDITIPSNVLPLLHFLVHDTDMQVVRFPDQNASLDDPHLDRFFHKVNDEWVSRDKLYVSTS